MIMGNKHIGDADEPMWLALIKCWCCGLCYTHQQYKEHDCEEGFPAIATTVFKPSQGEMS